MTRNTTLVGALAILLYAIHAGNNILRGEAWSAAWQCHLSCLWIGVGLIFRSPLTNGIGVLWLAHGLPMWIYYLASTHDFIPTSALTHLGGMAAGVVGLRELGMPALAWRKALAALLVWQEFTRLVAPPELNVNGGAAVWEGLEGWFRPFPDTSPETAYLLFWAFNVGLAALIFVSAERVARRLTSRGDSPPP